MKSISIILGANSKLLKYLDHKVFDNTVYYYFLYNKNFPKSQKIFLENKFGGVDKRFFKSNFNWIPYLVQDLKSQKVDYLQILNLMRYPIKKSNFSKVDSLDWIKSFATEPVELIKVIQNLLNEGVIGKKNLGGSIVSFSSYLGLYGSQDQIPYSISKASLMHFTKLISSVLVENNFRINTISFGNIDLSISKKPSNKIYVNNSKIGIHELLPMLRFLLSIESSAINGQNINLSR